MLEQADVLVEKDAQQHRFNWGISKLGYKPTLASKDLLHPRRLFRGSNTQNSIRAD